MCWHGENCPRVIRVSAACETTDVMPFVYNKQRAYYMPQDVVDVARVDDVRSAMGQAFQD